MPAAGSQSPGSGICPSAHTRFARTAIARRRVVNNTRVVPARVLDIGLRQAAAGRDCFCRRRLTAIGGCLQDAATPPPEAIRFVNHQIQDDVKLWLLERLMKVCGWVTLRAMSRRLRSWNG